MLRVCRLGVLLLLVVLGASPAPVSGSVESAGDAVTHAASSGTTKLSLNSDQGHQIQVGGTNVAVVDSSGMAVTGTFTYTAKPYVAGHKLSADLSLSNTVWTDLVWSSSASDVVANGAMSWSSNKIFTPTNSGLYKVTVSVCARLEAGATAGERSVGLRLTDSSDNMLRETFSHIGYYDSAVDTMTAITLGPLVVSLTGSTGYKFNSFSGDTGDGLLVSDSSTFIVEAFP
jgi:hypothetical protein